MKGVRLLHTGLYGEKAEALIAMALFIGNSDPNQNNHLYLSEDDMIDVDREWSLVSSEVTFDVAVMTGVVDPNSELTLLDKAKRIGRGTIGWSCLLRLPDQEVCLSSPKTSTWAVDVQANEFWKETLADNILHNLKCFERQVCHAKAFYVRMSKGLNCKIGLTIGHHKLAYDLPKEGIEFEMQKSDFRDFIGDVQRLHDGNQVDVAKAWLHPDPNVIRVEARKLQLNERKKMIEKVVRRCEEISKEYRQMSVEFWADKCFEVGQLLN